MHLEQNIKGAAMQLGYELCGIIKVDYFNDFVDGVEKLLDDIRFKESLLLEKLLN